MTTSVALRLEASPSKQDAQISNDGWGERKITAHGCDVLCGVPTTYHHTRYPSGRTKSTCSSLGYLV